jgi:hypothetical protein
MGYSETILFPGHHTGMFIELTLIIVIIGIVRPKMKERMTSHMNVSARMAADIINNVPTQTINVMRLFDRN